jgi:Domain of unknown function (DUF4407)
MNETPRNKLQQQPFAQAEEHLSDSGVTLDVDAGLQRLMSWMSEPTGDTSDDPRVTDIGRSEPAVKSGADRRLERFTAMLLLLTAALAGLSGGLAVNVTTGFGVTGSVLVGLALGLLIFSFDGMIIATMPRESSRWRALFSMLPSILLALVIGAVVTAPLGLSLFDTEVRAEIPALRADQRANRIADLDQRFADIDRLEAELHQLQLAQTQGGRPSVDDPDVQQALEAADAASRALHAAEDRLQCENLGICPPSVAGRGPAAREAQFEADQARRDLADANADLVASLSAAEKRVSERLESERLSRAQALALFDQTNSDNDGLAVRLEALHRIAAQQPSVQLAILATFLLVTGAGMLPVVGQLRIKKDSGVIKPRHAEVAAEAKAKLATAAMSAVMSTVGDELIVDLAELTTLSGDACREKLAALTSKVTEAAANQCSRNAGDRTRVRAAFYQFKGSRFNRLDLVRWQGGDSDVPAQFFDEARDRFSASVVRIATGRNAARYPNLDIEAPSGFEHSGRKFKSFMAAPVVAGDERIGVLTVDSDEVDIFTDLEEGYLQLLAGLLAAGVSHSRPSSRRRVAT